MGLVLVVVVVGGLEIILPLRCCTTSLLAHMQVDGCQQSKQTATYSFQLPLRRLRFKALTMINLSASPIAESSLHT